MGQTTPASLETSSNSTNLIMQHKHKTALRIQSEEVVFSLQTTFHEEFEPLNISDNSILLSSERHPLTERNDRLQVIRLCGHDTYSCVMVLPTSIMQILTSV